MKTTAMLIVEDQDYMRQALRAFLQSVFPDKKVLEAADGRSAMALCREHHPKLVLMDIALPDANGIELTAKIKIMMPDTVVIIVSSHSGSAYSERAKAAGASACIAKDAVYEHLLPAVSAALSTAHSTAHPSSKQEHANATLMERIKTDTNELRALIVEDSPLDAELMACALEKAGFKLTWTRAETEADYEAALCALPDIILSDYNLPHFSGPRALQLLSQHKLDIPFIVVSGTIGDEQAAEIIRLGADDFLLKDRLGRLGPAVTGALQRQRMRADMRRTENELKQTQARLQAFLDNSPAVMFMKDMDGRYLQINRRFAQNFGLDPARVIGRRDDELLEPQLAAQFQANDRAVLQADKPIEFEEAARYNDGFHTSIVAKFPLRDADGNVYGIGGIATDITGRKVEEERFRATFEQNAIGIAHSGTDGRFLRVNRKLCAMLGYSSEELLARTFTDVTHPDDWSQNERLRTRLLEDKTRLSSPVREKRYLRKDGTTLWAEISVSLVRRADGEPDYFVAMIQDIGNRKAAEAELRATFEQAAVGIVRADFDRNIIDANRRFCDMLGYDREEILRMRFQQISHPDDLGQDAVLRGQLVAGEISTFSAEKRYVRKDGKVIWARRTTSVARDVADGKPYYIIVVEDITERKRAEEAVKQERALLRAVVDAMPERVYVKDREGRFLMQNAANLKVRGIRHHSEIVGKTAFDIFPRELAERTHAEDQAVMKSGKPLLDREGQTFFGNGSEHHGGARWHLTSKVPLKDATGNVFGLVGVNRDITDRVRALQVLRESEQRFRAMFDHAGLGITMRDVHDRTQTWKQVNDHFCKLLGYSREELLKLSTADITYPDDQDKAVEDNRRLLQREVTSYTREKRLIRKDGSATWVMLTVTALLDEKGNPENTIAFYQDISKRKHAEEALQESDEKFRQLAENIPQVFWMTDVEQKSLIYVSPNYEQVTGRTLAELQANPRNWLEVIHEHDRERVRNARKTRAPAGEYDIEYRIVRTDRTIRWIHDRAFPVTNQHGEVYRIAGIGEDITERKEAQQKLMHLAHYDSLTSLPNRVLFHDRLKLTLAQAQRNGWITGLLFLDLDRFKTVNDTLGHGVGDLLLRQVSDRLMLCVRTGDTVGRLGGDEFAIILSELASPQDAGRVAQKIIDALAPSFDLEGHEVFVTTSIGVTVYPGDSQDIETLIRNADAAMYGAKNQGRNNYQFYTPAMNERALEKMQLETRLRRALERKEFLLHYQPKVSISSGEITGFEALLRWQHPENGLIPPNQFVPLLEETGLIVPVGEWVLSEACSQIRSWQLSGIEPVPVAINFSARQFLQPGLDGMISGTLAQYDIDPRWIEIEITESALMQNPEDAAVALRQIKALGISLSVDDFGTGYSSLNYLKRFPLDKLKIDRSFVRDIVADPDDAAITRAVVTMAHSLNLKVVAEGVESEEQLAFLSAHRCDEVQGYLLSRPLPAADCTVLLEHGKHLHRPMTGEASHELPAVLVLDDDANSLLLVQHLLQINGNRILTADSTDKAFDLLSRHRVAAIVSDQNMPDMPGVEFLKRVKHMYPGITRIMLSGAEDFQSAASAINEGEVHRFFVKGRDDEKLRTEVGRILQHGAQTVPAHNGTSTRGPGATAVSPPQPRN